MPKIPIEIVKSFQVKSEIEILLEEVFKELGFKNYQETKRGRWLIVDFEIHKGPQSITINTTNGEIEGSEYALSIIKERLKKQR